MVTVILMLITVAAMWSLFKLIFWIEEMIR